MTSEGNARNTAFSTPGVELLQMGHRISQYAILWASVRAATPTAQRKSSRSPAVCRRGMWPGQDYCYRVGEQRPLGWSAAIVPFLRWSSAAPGGCLRLARCCCPRKRNARANGSRIPKGFPLECQTRVEIEKLRSARIMASPNKYRSCRSQNSRSEPSDGSAECSVGLLMRPANWARRSCGR